MARINRIAYIHFNKMNKIKVLHDYQYISGDIIIFKRQGNIIFIFNSRNGYVTFEDIEQKEEKEEDIKAPGFGKGDRI